MKARLGITLMGALLVALAAGRAGAQPADWNKIVEAAKAEGKVVIYSGHVGAPYHPEIARKFEAKYGIKVEILDARASELRERIRTELAAGRVGGDISHNGGSTSTQMARQGLLQPHGYLPNLAKLSGKFKDDGVHFPVFVQSYGIVVNSRMVPENERPKSWLDLLDPKWKGKILSDDLRALGGGSAFFGASYPVLGRAFHEKLAQQNLQFSRAIRENPRRVARGEFPIYIPFSLSDILIHKGLPLESITPKEGNAYITYDVSLHKDAPHPNAGRVFMNFFLEEEAQMVYISSGRGATIGGMENKGEADVRAIANAKLMGMVDPDKQDELLRIAKEIYK